MKKCSNKILSIVLLFVIGLTIFGCKNESDKWIDDLSEKLNFHIGKCSSAWATYKEILDENNSYLDQKLEFVILFSEPEVLRVVRENYPKRQPDETLEEFELRVAYHNQSVKDITVAYVDSLMGDIKGVFGQLENVEYRFVESHGIIVLAPRASVSFIKQLNSFIINSDFIESILVTVATEDNL